MPSVLSVNDQWSAVFAAPLPFVLALIAVAAVVWGAMLWRYKGANEKMAELYDLLNKKAELENHVAAKIQNELKETIASLEEQKASLTAQIEDLQAKAQIDEAQKDQLKNKLASMQETISIAGRQLGTLSEANNAVSRTLSDSRRLISSSPISVTLPSGG